MRWENLTSEQQRVVTATQRRIIVFGGAGSGKTTTALWCARRLLESSNAKPWHRVLFLTFSRTAVREIVRRSGRALADVRGRVEIHTFHGFANRVIGAFGRYAGLGRQQPRFISDAEEKLLGKSGPHLTYDDLLPLALKIVRTPRIKRLITERWPLVISDEFQDTDDKQWELLRELCSIGGRMLLLADPNQMIYAGFLGNRGVGPRRVQEATEQADLVVDLGAPSHRDPSNVIPAMAAAIQKRDFRHVAVRAAIDQGRLKIHPGIADDELLPVLRHEIEIAWAAGRRSIGIFGHGNNSVAKLSASLFDAGVDHVLIGLSEAHAEALTTMELACLYGVGRASVEDLRLRLAVFVTASVRGPVPSLAQGLTGIGPLPRSISERLSSVTAALTEATTLGTLVRMAMDVWTRLGTTFGNRSWRQAARTFGAMAEQILRRAGTEADFFAELARQVTQQRADALLDTDVAADRSIQVMNFHQTKGREADVVILVYRTSDWFGRELEPFPSNSRLLYVSLTRARLCNVVILPPTPHPLVSPFESCLIQGRQWPSTARVHSPA